MTQEQVLARLKQILQADFRIAPDKVTPEATFRGTLAMDSLDVVDLIYLVSREFGLKPDVEAFADLDTVQKVVAHLSQKAAQG
ncbi:MAG: acyl carrier protein [Archangiaceae bacterium]|nr:acyl carrier protein [Archangiaceae bacterium]